MFIRATLSAILISLLTACETMLPYTKLPDNNTTSVAAGTAAINYCYKNNHMPSRLTADYNRAAARVLAATVENKELFSRVYEETLAEMQKASAYALAKECQDVQPRIPEIIAMMDRTSASAEQWRSQAIAYSPPAGMSMRDYSRDPIPVKLPSGEVTFGLKEINSTNVLIHSSGGTKICNVRSGGPVGLATCF